MREDELFAGSKWIGYPDSALQNAPKKVVPAPHIRTVFNYSEKSNQSAHVAICGLGFYELSLNGRKVGEQVLDPVVTQYDKRARYVVHDVTDYLNEGLNVIGVILGNGWYNCVPKDTWGFEHAPWRDSPKLLLTLYREDEVLVRSGRDWKVRTGPIVLDSLRYGETYDARLEISDWLTPEFDDSEWSPVALVPPPGGVLQKQTMPPCKVMQTLVVLRQWSTSSSTIYDFGQNLTGWARIAVRGEAGAEITIRYAERITDDVQLERLEIAKFVEDPSCFQTDHYILHGGDSEQWEPRFAYHGFQYVEISIEGEAKVEKVEARFVHTDFKRTGALTTSEPLLNRLQSCTEWSYLGNFTGIPTDCPHREKNGWTGDAHLAAETGLCNFDAALSYEHWLDSIVDTQRESGQLPAMIPTSGWGYNKFSGPAWDSALLLIPWYIYLYTGRDESIRRHYPAMRKYVDYCRGISDDLIVRTGLGDWCHWDRSRIVDVSLTSTAFFYQDAVLLARFAGILGFDKDKDAYSKLATEIQHAFNQEFYKGNGRYVKGEQTAQACALAMNLVDESERELVVMRLVESVNTNGLKPDFGILGAKWVPRALAENGYTELAYQLIMQPEFPGWVNWLKQGATTLWESWNGNASRNHIMFGDISAWFYHFLAGIRPDHESPGFRHYYIEPCFVSSLDWVEASHETPHGIILVNWRRLEHEIECNIQIPTGTESTIRIGDSEKMRISPGEHRITVAV